MKTKPSLATYRRQWRPVHRGGSRTFSGNGRRKRYKETKRLWEERCAAGQADSLLRKVNGTVVTGFLNQTEALALAQRFHDKDLIFDSSKNTYLTFYQDRKVELFLEEQKGGCRFVLYAKDHPFKKTKLPTTQSS